MIRGRRVLFASVFLILLLVPVLRLYERAPQMTVSDYTTYWLAADYIAQHPNVGIYSAQGEKAMHAYIHKRHGQLVFQEDFENTQTPFLYATVHCTSTGNLPNDFLRHQAAAMVVFGIALWYFFVQARLPVLGRILLVLYVLYVYPPFQSEFANANVNRWLLGTMAFGHWLGRRRQRYASFCSWVVWGLAVSFKPIVALAPALILGAHGLAGQRKRLRAEGAGLFCGGILAFLAGCLFFRDWSCWLSWLSRVKGLPLSASPLEHFNFSLPILVAAGLDMAIPTFILGMAIAIACLTVLRIWFRDPSRRVCDCPPQVTLPAGDSEFLLAALGLLIYLLWAPLVWFHYHMLSLPLIVILFRRNMCQWPIHGIGSALLASLTLVTMVLVSSMPILLLHSALNVLLIVGGLMWLGAALLFTLGLIELHRASNSPAR